MSTWKFMDFDKRQASDVETDMLTFLNTLSASTLVKLGMGDASEQDAYGIVVYRDTGSTSVTRPPITANGRWTSQDFTTPDGVVAALNSMDAGEAVAAHLTARKLRTTVTLTLFTPHAS